MGKGLEKEDILKQGFPAEPLQNIAAISTGGRRPAPLWGLRRRSFRFTKNAPSRR
jgi:hypothetical protein